MHLNIMLSDIAQAYLHQRYAYAISLNTRLVAETLACWSREVFMDSDKWHQILNLPATSVF